MNLLFISNPLDEEYDAELTALHKYLQLDKKIYPESFVNIDFLKKNNINVVVNSGLSSEHYLMLQGMKIPTITFGPKLKYKGLSDITIDFKSGNKREYFSGTEFAVEQSNLQDFKDIIHLITPLTWDTKYWGKNIAYLSCLHLTESIWWQVSEFCSHKKIDLIEYLCNCHDSRSVIIAEKSGFHLVDIRITLSIKVSNQIPIEENNQFEFNIASQQDLNCIKNMSSDIYIDSRYYFDENFDREKAKQFYCEWAAKGVLGEFDDMCLCIYDKQQPIAFCTVKFDKLNQDTVQIGLFGVSQMYQGINCGKILLKHVLNFLHYKSIKNVFVVTQARNIQAINLYESCGFKVFKTQLWYHKWIQI